MKTLAISSQKQLILKPSPHISDAQRIGSSQQLRINNDDHCESIRGRHRSRKSTSILSFALVLPSRLAQRSLQIDVRRAAQSWSLSLRPYRTIPYDAEIWQSIQRGDFDRMRNLIESGQATVFDRRDDGYTLLHVCFEPLLLIL